jgi:hypothetical protein
LTLHPIPSEFTNIWEKFYFLFYQCSSPSIRPLFDPPRTVRIMQTYRIYIVPSNCCNRGYVFCCYSNRKKDSEQYTFSKKNLLAIFESAPSLESYKYRHYSYQQNLLPPLPPSYSIAFRFPHYPTIHFLFLLETSLFCVYRLPISSLFLTIHFLFLR